MGETAWPRRATAAILVAGWLAMLAMGAPGQLSYDSIVQLGDGRSGHYDSWHPPVMALLLGLFDRVVPGSLLFLIAMSGLMLAALLWLLWLPAAKPVRWAAALVALFIVLTPQWLLYQTDIWKDVLFADAALAGFAALARAAADWPGRRRWLAGAVLLLSLAAMTRQNGLVLLPVGAVAFVLIAARHMPRKAAMLQGAGLLLVMCVLSFGANAILIAHGDGGDGAQGELRYAQSYDLAGALATQPSMKLAALDKSDPELAKALRERGVRLYSTRQLDTLIMDRPVAAAIDDAPAGAIFAQWQELVLRHPGLYLQMRLPVFWQVLATPDVRACHPLYAGIGGPPEIMKSLGLRPSISARARALFQYANFFIGSPLFSHLAFAALAAALLVLFLRRGGGADLAMAGLMAGVLVFALTFLIVSVACDYRYLYFLDVAALTGSFYTARSFTFS